MQEDIAIQTVQEKKSCGRRKSREQLSGRFGIIDVVGFVGVFHGGRAAKYKIRCDCGVEKEMWERSITHSRTGSCGCLAGAAISSAKTTHGMTNSSEFKIWVAMIVRCTKRNAVNYADYGGRGISVCDRWMVFANFYADVGARPSLKHSLDRFPNNDGNYEPGNCRWATDIEQHRNKRSNVMLTFNGVTLSMSAWSEKTGISYHAIVHRVNRGWTVERTLTTPVKTKKETE